MVLRNNDGFAHGFNHGFDDTSLFSVVNNIHASATTLNQDFGIWAFDF